jgi:hypothetical protein
VGFLVLRKGPVLCNNLADSPSISRSLVLTPSSIPHRIPKLPQHQIALIFFIVLSTMMRSIFISKLHNILIPSSSVRHILLETGIRARLISTIERTKFHEVSYLWNSLMRICDVSSTIVRHNISIPSCSRWRVVYGPTLIAEKSALVMLVNHYLILFIGMA